MSDDKEMSDASSNATVLIVNAAIELYSRKDVFYNIKAFSETEQANHLSYEEKRFLDNRIKSGERNGLLLEKMDLHTFLE